MFVLHARLGDLPERLGWQIQCGLLTRDSFAWIGCVFSPLDPTRWRQGMACEDAMLQIVGDFPPVILEASRFHRVFVVDEHAAQNTPFGSFHYKTVYGFALKDPQSSNPAVVMTAIGSRSCLDLAVALHYLHYGQFDKLTWTSS